MGIRDLMAIRKNAVELQAVNRNECSIGVMCTEDGSIRYFNDDGEGGVDRAKLVEMSNEKDKQTGMPIWCLVKPMEQWTGANKRTHSPIHFRVLDAEIEKYIEESKAMSAKFNEAGRLANAALVEQVKIPAAKAEVKK